jgi:Mce-associated membrane protein
MTKQRSGDADTKSDKPEGKSAAVGVRADAESKQDTEKVETAEPAEGEANEREDIENEGVEPSKAKRRIGRVRERSVKGPGAGGGPQPRARGVKAPSGDADDESGQREGESLGGEAEKPSDDPDLLDALDSDEAEAAVSDDADVEETAEEAEPTKIKRRISWSRVVVYGLLPGMALVLAGAAGFLKWQDSSARETQLARIESLAAAKDSTIALLSYKSDTVEKDLEGAKNRMTGAFKDSYSQLINDVVIPGAKRQHISTTATVPAAASVSATPNHAVTLLFVNQTAVVDKSPPTDSLSSVRVTLDKIDGRWLIAGFDPV